MGSRLLTFVSASTLLVAALAGAPSVADAQPRARGRKYVPATRSAVPGQFIVRLTDGNGSVGPAAAALAGRHRGRVLQSFRSLPAFVVQMSETDARALAEEPMVAYVEEDALVFAVAAQSRPDWGLDRIDQRTLPLNSTYVYAYTGAGVNAYVLDSGIRTTHAQFGGRALAAFDALDDGQNGNDCNGHGTHVAGTIGATTYGVAKAARLYGVRVLGCDGNGTVSGVIAGIDWVTINHLKPAVANMSIGGGPSSAMDEAVRRSVEAGVTVVVAASNDASDACLGSPARAPEAITVGATDRLDQRASFSNFGTCLDLFAPGVGVTSASNASDTASAAMSGTSMASPHVAGAAALFLQANRFAAPERVASALSGMATPNAVADAMGSPNLLLYVGAVSSGTDQTPPAVTLSSPGAGAALSGVVSIAAQATDNVAVSRVQFFVDRKLVATDSTAPYGARWNSAGETNGTHQLYARAVDSSGNLTATPLRAFTVSNPGNATYDDGLRAPVCGTPFKHCDAITLLEGRGPLGPEPNAPNSLGNSCSDGDVGTYLEDESLNRLRIYTVDGTNLAPGKAVRVDAQIHAFSTTEDMLDVYATADANNPAWILVGSVKPTTTGSGILTVGYTLPPGALQAVRGVFRYQGSADTCPAGPYDDVDDLAFVTAAAPPPDPSRELIASGGFEPSVAGWTRTGAAYFSTGGVERSGVGYAYLAKANSVTGALEQRITIPAGTAPSLSFWLNVTSSEPSSSVASDRLFVEVLDTGGALLETLGAFSNLHKGAAGAYVHRSGYALGAYAGQTIRLRFRAAVNAVNITAFRIDDVSVRTTAPPPPPSELIVSGGFEPPVSGWTKSGAAAFSTGGQHRTGVGYAYLAKAHSATGTISQTLTLPAGTNPMLTFGLNVTSEETGTVAADRLIVDVLDADGSLLKRIGTFSNVNRGAVREYVVKGGYPLGAFAGRTVRLRFRATTDAARLTTFRIDDVSVK